MNHLARTCVFAASAALCLAAPGQTPSSPAKAPTPADFAAEPYIIQSASTSVTIQPDGTGTRVLTIVALLQSEAAVRQSSVVSVAYASHSERADYIYVRVTHSDGTREETPVSSAIEQPAPVTQQAPLYSDLQNKQLPVRSLRVGDTLEWQARITTEHPEVAQSWGQDTFLTNVVVLDETYELRAPSTLPVTTWTNPHEGGDFTQSDTAGTHLYRWHHTALRPTVGPVAEAYAKSEQTRLRTADEELDALEGALPSFAWTTFSAWDAVGAWYRTLNQGLTTPDDAIKAKVAELTAGKSSDLEKAQAVYVYVSTEIRYVGVDFGIGRYKPHPASEVFANRYGDCKDKHTLLASMLSVLHLHADPVLIGASIRFNPAVPAPSAFNHLITHLTLNGKDVWLDATAEIGSWGALLYPLRDKQALLVPSASAAVIDRTPADLPYPQYTNASVTGSLDPSLTSDSRFTITFHGDTELYLRAVLHSVSPAQYGQFVQSFMANIGFGGTTSEPAIDHLNDPDTPLAVSFHYHRVKEKDWGENRITAAFLPVGLPAFNEQNPPTSSIVLGVLRTETSTLALKLPDGWSAAPPEPVHARTDFAAVDVTYSVKDHTLYAERKVTILKFKIPVTDYKRYQAWFDQADAGGYPYLQALPKPKDVSSSTIAAPEPPSSNAALRPSDPKAAELVRQGFTKIQSMDMDAARTSFDQANAINPTEAGLWSGYAAVAQMLGKPSETISDLKLEASYHPNETQIYKPLTQMQFAAKDNEGALSTLRAWVTAAPESGEAPYMLGSDLWSMKRTAEALSVVNNAIARPDPAKTDLTDLRILAGDLMVDSGQQQQAAESVAPFLNHDLNPTQTNHVAYILAQAGTHLPQAETAQAQAIASQETNSLSLSLSAELPSIFREESGMAACWDTMGWILYREGKLDQAFGYLQAAAQLTGHAAVRQHLDAVAKALHRPGLAGKSDLELRTISLGQANGRHGVASVTLLIVGGMITDSTPSRELSASTPTLDHAEDLLKRADLHSLLPPGSRAHLIRTGFVNCHPNTCELILSPLP